jgi:hypothetical protein
MDENIRKSQVIFRKSQVILLNIQKCKKTDENVKKWTNTYESVKSRMKTDKNI